jgi:very-short-patch-repair endonuclease
LRTDTFPTLVGEVLPGVLEGRPVFPFLSWAQSNRFTFPPHARPFLARCGSAVEAYFARAFVQRADTRYVNDQTAIAGDFTLQLQVRVANYYIDAVVSDAANQIAVEIDGMGFHHRSKEQVAADYLRQRRIVLKGFTVIRFTAKEVLVSPEECWRQVEAILAARRRD